MVISHRIPLTDLQQLYGHHERAVLGFEHENKNRRRTLAHLKRCACCLPTWHWLARRGVRLWYLQGLCVLGAFWTIVH